MLVPFMQPALCQALDFLKGLHSKKVPCSRHYKVVKWCNLFRTQDLKTITCSVALLYPLRPKRGVPSLASAQSMTFMHLSWPNLEAYVIPEDMQSHLSCIFLMVISPSHSLHCIFKVFQIFSMKICIVRYQQNNRLEYQIIIHFWETAHLPLP